MTTAETTLPELRRSSTNRVVAGVCGGLGEWLGLDPLFVRVAAIVLAAAAGVGVLAYAVAWVVIPTEPDGAAPARVATASAPPRRVLGLALVVLAVVLVVRRLGIAYFDVVVWPVALFSAGAAVLWRQSDPERVAGPARTTTARTVLRLLVGGAMIVTAVLWLLVSGEGVASTAAAPLVAAVAVLAGLAVVFAPWLTRLVRALQSERAERIREQERAEVAAHLHDSVLQSLALIQRQAADPDAVSGIARTQERELREWLYGGPAAETGTLATAVTAMASEIEDAYRVAVEVVCVGDAALGSRAQALLGAAREAVTNAAKWSGAELVSVYCEVEDSGAAATVYVRDRGVGFDPDSMAPGRHGISESIRARMARHGGTAQVSSQPGEGTEVVLRMPLGEAG